MHCCHDKDAPNASLRYPVKTKVEYSQPELHVLSPVLIHCHQGLSSQYRPYSSCRRSIGVSSLGSNGQILPFFVNISKVLVHYVFVKSFFRYCTLNLFPDVLTASDATVRSNSRDRCMKWDCVKVIAALCYHVMIRPSVIATDVCS